MQKTPGATPERSEIRHLLLVTLVLEVISTIGMNKTLKETKNCKLV